MPSLTDRRKATQRRALSKQHRRIKVYRKLRGTIARARVNITKRRKLINASTGSSGEKAVRYLMGFAGKTETPFGSNDGPFLRTWENGLGHDRLDWMIPGNPWCGLAAIAGWKYGAGKLLPDDTVSTIAIANRAARGDGFTKVAFDDARVGDLVVMHMGSGGPKHVGLARSKPSGGSVATVEGNTSFSNGGSQSNGGAVAPRVRSRGLVHTIARPK